MLEAADPYQELSEGEAIGVIDRFALQHRLPNGKTMLDQFLAGRPDLTAADREMLRALFADPALAAGKQYTGVLRGYLGSETIGPLPFRRLAAAHPDTVDAVFRKVLRKPNFTWAEHGEAVMRRRKPWYCEREPRPGISVIGARLSELVRR